MRKLSTLLIVLLWVITNTSVGKAASAPEEQPVVHAVLFWINGCTYCSQTLTTIVPALQDKYQARLSIRLIELVSSKDVDDLYALGTSFGLTKQQISVPFLLIDHTALIGVDEIGAKLPALVDKYLAQGGIGYPDIPLLNDMLPKGIDFATSDIYLNHTPQTVGTNSTGMALAWVVMVFMWLAVLAGLAMIIRAFQGKALGGLKAWLNLAMPILAFIGLGASIYLTYVETTHTSTLCGPVGDCNAVQSSPYARLFGFLPIGLLGAIGYIAILVTWFWQTLRRDALARIAGPAMYGMALFGSLFSIYLTYLELFVIRAVCIWCLSSAVIITILMLFGLPSITQWLAISDEED